MPMEDGRSERDALAVSARRESARGEPSVDLHVVQLIGEVLLIGVGLAFAGSAAWIGRRTHVLARRWALLGIAMVSVALAETLYDLQTVGLITASTASALELVRWLLIAAGIGCLTLNMLMGPFRS
jgi:hypothetical protein